MYIQVVSLLAVPFVATVCDATSDTAERDAFYKQVSTVSRSLDPRDYIVDPEVNQSNKYNNAHMDMIGEMTIFYYAEAVADKHVTLSLTSSEQQDYEVKFEIYEEEAYLVEYNGSAKNVNYARVDDNMMRFYVCFLGKLCPMYALSERLKCQISADPLQDRIQRHSLTDANIHQRLLFRHGRTRQESSAGL
uniref:Secreted protein n=1 Tax=Panagrellus redivivus TaxID=6233 RepID=A0A7E4VEB9_PANRE